MGLTEFRAGRHICEDLGITPLKLAELCHLGKLAAYRFEDRQQILASSQCSAKFKFAGNTTFTIEPRNKSSFMAIGNKCIDDFCVYVEAKYNMYNSHQQILHTDNQHVNMSLRNTSQLGSRLDAYDMKYRSVGCKEIIDQAYEEHRKFIEPLARESRIWIKKFKEMEIKYCDKKYIVYYNNFCPYSLDRRSARFYGSDQVFFELKGEKCEIDLEYLEMNDYSAGGIKSYKTKLSIEKKQDSFGNDKFILSEYDKDIIRITTDIFLSNSFEIVVDEGRLKRDGLYFQKYMDMCTYLQQCAFDYFRKEDPEGSKPLKHEVDFFIFDYDEYKKRFYYLEDEETSRNRFFNYICKLVFDGKEVCNVLKYEFACAAIRDNPKKYMIWCCKELEVTYKEDKDTLMIIRGYELAIEGYKWNDIDDKLWMHSKDKDSSMVFVSRKIKAFEKIAKDNCIPFIDAKRLANMKSSEKEAISEDMLSQIESFNSSS